MRNERKAPPRALHLCSSDESKEIAILGRHGAKWQSSLEKQRKKLVLSEERKEERKRGLERISTGCVFFSAPGEKKLDSAPSPSLSLSFCRLLTCRIVMLILRRRGMTTVVEGSG